MHGFLILYAPKYVYHLIWFSANFFEFPHTRPCLQELTLPDFFLTEWILFLCLVLLPWLEPLGQCWIDAAKVDMLCLSPCFKGKHPVFHSNLSAVGFLNCVLSGYRRSLLCYFTVCYQPEKALTKSNAFSVAMAMISCSCVLILSVHSAWISTQKCTWNKTSLVQLSEACQLLTPFLSFISWK